MAPSPALAEILGEAAPLDRAAERSRRLELRGSAERHGRLVELAAQLAGMGGIGPDAAVRLVAFAGEHGLAARDVSPLEPSAAPRRAALLADGRGALGAAAGALGLGIEVVADALPKDSGLPGAGALPAGGAPDREDAMDEATFEAALRTGAARAEALSEAGVGLAVPHLVGPGGRVAALAFAGHLLDEEPVAMLGFSGTDDALWSRQVAALRDVMTRARATPTDPAELVRRLLAPHQAVAVGFLARLAALGIPALVSSAEAAALGLAAELLSPGARGWLLGGQLAPAGGLAAIYSRLGIRPVFALHADDSLGAGALAAVPLVRFAAALGAED